MLPYCLAIRVPSDNEAECWFLVTEAQRRRIVLEHLRNRPIHAADAMAESLVRWEAVCDHDGSPLAATAENLRATLSIPDRMEMLLQLWSQLRNQWEDEGEQEKLKLYLDGTVGDQPGALGGLARYEGRTLQVDERMMQDALLVLIARIPPPGGTLLAMPFQLYDLVSTILQLRPDLCGRSGIA